jgi:hypothetical protein
MTTIQIPDETFERLQKRAQIEQTTVESLLERVSMIPPAPPWPLPLPTMEERLANLREWKEELRVSGPIMPPGQEVDISRDAMYPDD